MANIFVRSPFYVSKKDLGGTAAYGILTIQVDGTTVYTLRKNISQTYVLFEIAELLRDYLNIAYDPDTNFYQTHSETYQTSVQLYTSANATVGSPEVVNGFIIDAYGSFEEGSNPTTTAGYMQSNDIIYKLADSDIRIPVDRNNTTSVAFLYQNNIVYSRLIASSASYVFEYVSNGVNAYDSFKDRVVQLGGSYEPNECIIDFLDEYEIFEVDQINIATTDGLRIVKVNTIEECKYKPAKISFINKFGGLQDLWFFRKSIKQLRVTKEEYKRFEIGLTGTYDTLKHPRKTFNIQGAKSITLNTGYVDESYNEVVEQMMQSEYVWMEQDTVVTPMVVNASSLTYKTGVNDKLVDYTLSFSYAFDNIQNIR